MRRHPANGYEIDKQAGIPTSKIYDTLARLVKNEFAVVAKEYIRHDIWGRILIDELGEARFGQLCSENELLSFLIRNP